MQADAHRRPIAIHVLPATPGLPLLPLASLLGAGGGMGSRSAADQRIYRQLSASAGSEFALAADAARADLLLHPHDALEHPAAAHRASQAAAALAKPTAFLSASDHVAPSVLPWGVLWRTSAFRSRLRAHERVATGDVPDLMDEREAAHPTVLPWRPTPKLGFIGHVASGWRSLPYLRKGWQNYHGFTLRERVLRAFEGSDAVEPRFVRRGTNLGPPMADIDVDADRRRKRSEYIDSVFGCDYALCVRGAGNWSFRFFEALSAGRIPVLVDTDAPLPLDGEIDWAKHLCRVPIARLPDAPRILADFHRQLGPTGFATMQAANRALWSGTLSPSAFYPRVLRGLANGAAGGR
jgi:hypothetical protein